LIKFSAKLENNLQKLELNSVKRESEDSGGEGSKNGDNESKF